MAVKELGFVEIDPIAWGWTPINFSYLSEVTS